MRHAKGCKCYHCCPYEAQNPEHLPKSKWPASLGGSSMHPPDCKCTWCISPEELQKQIAAVK